MLREDIEKFEELHSKLNSLKGDFVVLSGKKPNETVNEFKLKLINKLLTQINGLIGAFKPDEDFDVFDLVGLPTNSDVLMMLNLYLNGMSRYKDANSTEHSSPIDWSSEIKTKAWDVED